MLRDTMTRTIPVAMIAIEALWTDRFHRLRAVRNVPPDRTLKPIQMRASAATIPNRRVSTSSRRSTPVTGASAERTVSTPERIGGGRGGPLLFSPRRLGPPPPPPLPPPLVLTASGP